MKPSECGFAYPPADGTPAREAMDRMTDFLKLAGRASKPGADGRIVLTREEAAGRWVIRNDPELRGFVIGAYPITIDDLA